MCGRYRFDPGITSVGELGSQSGLPLAAVSPEAAGLLAAGGIFRPYNDVPVLAEDQEGQLHLTVMYWQLIHYWCEQFESKYTNFNTRRESLPKKHNRELLCRHRCLLPVTSFFETRREPDGSLTKPRETYEFFSEDGGLIFLGGIYSIWKNPAAEHDRRLSCSIITLEPNDIVGEVHPRMPFIVPAAHRAAWLDRGRHDFHQALDMIQPVASATLRREREK